MQDAARQAIEHLGGLSAAARLFDVTPGAIHKWVTKRVPAERVLELERATESRVTRYQLRPDLYPTESAR